MSWWSRIANLLRNDRLNREIDEELESHLAEALGEGRNPAEARAAFGSLLRHREESRGIRLIARLDSLRADAVFGWRQLAKRKVTSAAAVLSLALAIGACTSAFRLIDALLLRPLPVQDADRLYVISRHGIDPSGKFRESESSEYPLFRMMRAAVKGQAELIAISYPDRADITFGSDEEMEKVHRQYVSGWMFGSFGLRPAAGRLFTENDDRTPLGHPYAVLSHDYWKRRFGQDPRVVGRSFRMGNDSFEIVGVAEERFTGTETGTVIDVFLPTMMHPGVPHSDWSWFRPLVCLHAGVEPGPVLDRLRVPHQAFQEQRAKGFTGMPKSNLEAFLNQKLALAPASAGFSEMQKDNRRGLIALGVLVALVLLIACANVANLMTAQAASRAREMALRVSIGAGRCRLVQLVLLESAWMAFLAAALGALIAWQSAPLVVSMINPPDNPARLFLPADWRVTGFGLALAFVVTFLFGLAPALRASAVKPVTALKGGEDPHARRRLMHGLIAVQVAFCFLVHFVGGLFISSFDRLAHQPVGFAAERLLTLETVARRGQPVANWDQVAEHLRATPGVEKVGLAGWPLLSGNGWNGFIAVNGAPPTDLLAYFLGVSPDWRDAMKIPLLAGRDLRPDDRHPGVALVNDAFAKFYFKGEDPIGKSFEKAEAEGVRTRYQIIGVVGDARYRNMREPITPTAFVPFFHRLEKYAPGSGTFLVRTSAADPMAVAQTLRRAVTQARSEFRVSTIRTQEELVRQHTVRERLLAMLAMFFAVVALALAAVGLYGVLDYSVLQRRREIGIRIAIGARAGDIARRVTAEVFSMVVAGSCVGLALGIASEHYIGTLLYQTKATDGAAIALPSLTILGAALCASLPPVIRAVRINPAGMLRAD
jgi:predicted permease